MRGFGRLLGGFWEGLERLLGGIWEVWETWKLIGLILASLGFSWVSLGLLFVISLCIELLFVFFCCVRLIFVVFACLGGERSEPHERSDH